MASDDVAAMQMRLAALRVSTSPAVNVARERNENTRVRRPAASNER
jgi:hypothetical protein